MIDENNKDLTPIQEEEIANMESLKNGEVKPKRKRVRHIKSQSEKTEPKKVEPTTPTPEQEEKERQLEEDFLYGMFMSVVDKLKQHTITFGLEYPDRRYNSWKQVNREGARRLSLHTGGMSFYGLLASLLIEETVIYTQIRKVKKQLKEQKEMEQERYGNGGMRDGSETTSPQNMGATQPITPDQLEKMA